MENKKKWYIGALSVLGLIILGWIVTTLLDEGKESVEKALDEEKYIAVVMSQDPNSSFNIPQEFLDGFGRAESLTNLNDQVINIKYKQDLGSTRQAERKAEELVKDENCVLIIGNSNSQLTNITVDKILKHPNPPSLIMPIATATDIISMADEEGFKAILRVVPDNGNQASQIERFVTNRKKGKQAKVAILIDEENETYSKDLADKIVTKVRDNNGRIVLKKNYGDASRLIDYLEKLKGNEPDFFIFVGISPNGLSLVDEMKTFQINIPVIFTDGCTVKQLINESNKLPQDTYFLSAALKEDSSEDEPTYKPIGVDTKTLVKLIIEGSKAFTREEVRKHIESNKSTFTLTKQEGGAGGFNFDSRGNNEALRFNIYHNSNGKLVLENGY